MIYSSLQVRILDRTTEPKGSRGNAAFRFLCLAATAGAFMNSNRGTYEKLEIDASYTKQTAAYGSNRGNLRLSRSISSRFRTPQFPAFLTSNLSSLSSLTPLIQSHRFNLAMRTPLKSFLLAAIFCFSTTLAFPQSQPPTQQPPQPREYSAAGEATQPNWPPSAVRGAHAMVVSDEALASEAGVEILKKGGNAVDAAVAVGFALAVVEPSAGNIAGGGFMLVRMNDGRAKFIDYREEAPKKATRDMYVGPDGKIIPGASTTGWRAIGVPGTVAGLALAAKTYGKLTLAEDMAPAIRLAKDGYAVNPRLAGSLRASQDRFENFPESKRIFLRDGNLYSAGDTFSQPELAATLERIAKNGAEEFYRGQTAKDLTAQMAQNGGLITMADLAAYHAKIREPLVGSYRARGNRWTIITSPPPSSGGVAILEALNILEPYHLTSWDDAQSVHLVIEAMRRVFADRATYLGDSDFTHVPIGGLLNQQYAAERRASINPTDATSSAQIGAGNPVPFDRARATSTPAAIEKLNTKEAAAVLANETQHTHTTHFSVVDADGNAVANTYTLNDSYGSAVTSTDGFLLNDEMDDFTSAPGKPNMFGLLQSEANAIEPGHRPLSSMVPTIVLRDGQLSFVTGSPGGPRIISATLLSVLNWAWLGMDAQQDINAPRFHQQWMPDVVLLEQTFPQSVAQQLEQRGYHLAQRRSWIGEVEAIGVDPKTGERLGAPDPRREGVARGY
jgi:gamma-glutamyltranspeptidase / glutathione hydrolase